MKNIVDVDEFIRVLEDLYEEDPCRVLPNAIWKTKERLSSLQCSFTEIQGKGVELKAWNDEVVHVLWNKDRKIDPSFRQIMEKSSLMVIHDDYVRQIETTDAYRVKKPFFSLRHDHEDISAYSMPKGFYIKEARPEGESGQISDLIKRCYKDLKPSPETVRSWALHKTFDPTLWIWIMDHEKGTPAALGIAELDPKVPEGALEWIQVLPEYQGSGFGKILVLELLNRIKGKAKFTTVSGEVDNETNPERLYRSCGFMGNDTWWLLRR